MKLINVSLCSQHVLSVRLIARLKGTFKRVPKENVMMEKSYFLSTRGITLWKLYYLNEWIDDFKNPMASKQVHKLSWVSNVKVIVAQFIKGIRSLHIWKRVSKEETLKLDSRRAYACPRDLGSTELCGNSPMLGNNLWSGLSLSLTPWVQKLQTCWWSPLKRPTSWTLLSGYWASPLPFNRFAILSFHSTFLSHFCKSPAVLRWPLEGIECGWVELRDIWKPLSKPGSR